MGIRKGQGFGSTKPRRKTCPECGKRGVTDWKPTATGLCRHCQYCQAAWGEAGWALACETASPPPVASQVLTLALKGEYFDEISAGTKDEEFRLVNEFWRKRLEGRVFEKVVITKGYPKADDQSRRLEFAWDGFVIKSLTHPHFGKEPVAVYAISLKKPLPIL